jgi:hypothetical protein
MLKKSRTEFLSDVVHEVVPMRECAVINPILCESVHHEPCKAILFREDSIVTSDMRGVVRSWKRPVVKEL